MLPVIVAPIVKALAANGLNLLATAVMQKGKEVVEDKLGVKLEENITPELAEKYRQLEFDREELLLKMGLENRRLDQEEFKTEVADKDSARKRDQGFTAAGLHNWRADLMFFLAVLMIAGLVYLIWKDPSINEYMKGIFTLVLGRFLGYLDNIYNFEFGTTRNNRTKDTTIEHLSKGGRS